VDKPLLEEELKTFYNSNFVDFILAGSVRAEPAHVRTV
jgi:hypothetical protein